MDEQTKLKRRLEKLLKRVENSKCADCNRKGARWASVNLGSFFCIECSGIHRNLGVHVSFVRSIGLDTWTKEQVEFMEAWGNERANAYYEGSLPSSNIKPSEISSVAVVSSFIRDKYVHKKYLASSVPPVKVAAKSVTKPTQASSSRTAQVKRAPQTPARHQTQEQKEYPQNKEKVERRTADSSPSEAAVFDPLVKTERLDLKSLCCNLVQSSVAFNSCTFHSEKYIAVKNMRKTDVDGEGREDTPQLIVVSPPERKTVVCQPTFADSIIMHPDQCIAALRSGFKLQMFDLRAHSVLKSFFMQEEIVFWRWVSPQLVGVVTAKAVYHWPFRGETSDDQSGPVKIFDRNSNLKSTHKNMHVMPLHVVNYLVSESGKWCLLVSITYCQNGEFVGEMQLFSVEKGVGQLLSGRSGVFTCLDLGQGRRGGGKVEVLCFEHKNEEGVCVVRMMEIGFDSSKPGESRQRAFKTEPVLLQNLSFDDFPVGMAVCSRYQLLYVFTSRGTVYLISIESGLQLHHQPVEVGTIFACCSTGGEDEGVLYLTRNSTVLTHISISMGELSLLLSSKNLFRVAESLRSKDSVSMSLTTTETLSSFAALHTSSSSSSSFSSWPSDTNNDYMLPPTSSSADYDYTLPPAPVSPPAKARKETISWSQPDSNHTLWSNDIVDVFDAPPPPSCASLIGSQHHESDTIWDTKQIQTNAFAATTANSSSSPLCRRPPTADLQLSAAPLADIFNAHTTPPCADCSNLMEQLEDALSTLDKTIAENNTLKESVHVMSNRLKMLFTSDDCDAYEQELLQSFQSVKERKAALLRDKEKTEHDQKYCVICLERVRDVILLPCGHICLCQVCVTKNDTQCCPLDRTKIDNYQIVYF